MPSRVIRLATFRSAIGFTNLGFLVLASTGTADTGGLEVAGAGGLVAYLTGAAYPGHPAARPLDSGHISASPSLGHLSADAGCCSTTYPKADADTVGESSIESNGSIR